MCQGEVSQEPKVKTGRSSGLLTQGIIMVLSITKSSIEIEGIKTEGGKP